jgi:hypothetical protein
MQRTRTSQSKSVLRMALLWSDVGVMLVRYDSPMIETEMIDRSARAAADTKLMSDPRFLG